jgi:DNA-directed RNA polymerase subunit RPC12/RpoP
MSDEKTKLNWMETRTQEVSQYHCVQCEEIFQFASDKHGTEQPPICCPMCGGRGDLDRN